MRAEIDRKFGRRWWEFWRRDLPKRPKRSESSKIARIVVEDDDVTFFFEDNVTDEPWAIEEFVQGSRTREGLEKIEAAIIDFNHPPLPLRWAIGCPSGRHANDGRCDCR